MKQILELNPLLPIALFVVLFLTVLFFRKEKFNAVLLVFCLFFLLLVASPQGKTLQKQTNSLPGFSNKWRCFSGTLFSTKIASSEQIKSSPACRYRSL